MKLDKFNRIFCALVSVLMLGMIPAWAEEPVVLQQDIDVRIPRVEVPPPVSPIILDMFEALPERSFLSIEVEPSRRVETNPYQVSKGTALFDNSTDAFRIQTTVTTGYAFTPRTRISAQFFLLSDEVDDFTQFSLDNTSQSVGGTLEHVLLQRQKWSLRGSATIRQVFSANGSQTGDMIPSLTWIRSLGNRGWCFLNSALVFSRSDFVIGSTERFSPLVTAGIGYQVPYGAASLLSKVFGGTVFSLSSTYTHTNDYQPAYFYPKDYDSIIVTAEMTRPLYQNSPLQVFFRTEPVFNFGHNTDSFGISGFNLRLFGGLRMTLAKPAIFTVDLDGDTP